MNALAFRNTRFEIVDRNNQPWMRLPQIGVALGYKRGHKVQQVFDRHADEFTDSMTAVVDLDTEGGKQQVRIFSLRGAHLLGMFARTEPAKEFRRWVLDVLEQYAQPATHQPRPTRALPHGLSAEQCDSIKALVKARVDACPKDKQAKAAITCWSALKSKYGVTYKEIDPEHYTEALSLIARLALDGELLEAEPHGQYHYPLDLWQPTNRIGRTGWITYAELARMEDRRPLAQLLLQLKADGNNIEAAKVEYEAMRLALESMYWQFDTLRRMFSDPKQYGLNVTFGEVKA
jgi:prophage antirepressor-like protein